MGDNSSPYDDDDDDEKLRKKIKLEPKDDDLEDDTEAMDLSTKRDNFTDIMHIKTEPDRMSDESDNSFQHTANRYLHPQFIWKKRELSRTSQYVQTDTCGLQFAPSEMGRTDQYGELYSCKQCETAFNDSKEFIKHVTLHFKDKLTQRKRPFVEAKDSMPSNHLEFTASDRPYKCGQCGSSFRQIAALKAHLKIHTGEKPFTCSTCDLSFRHSDSLKRHQRTHTGEKPYKCDKCEASYSTSSGLKYHTRTHTGEKPYKCSHCGTAYIRPSSLKYHLQTHFGDKLYKCDDCGERFRLCSDLKRHLIARGNGTAPNNISKLTPTTPDEATKSQTVEKPFTCNRCNAAFSAWNALTYHFSQNKCNI